MRVSPGKSVSKFWGIWTFLLLLIVKGAFPKPAYAFLSSLDACAANPECVAVLGSELAPAVAAPTAEGVSTTITATTATGATTTTEAAAGITVVGDMRLSGVAAYYIWQQAQNQQAQTLAQQKYCAAYSNDSVCVPFTGGQLPILYDVFFSFHYQTGPYSGNVDTQPYNTNNRALQVYGPIRNFGVVRPISLDYNNPTYDYILGTAGSWGVYNRNGFGFCPFVVASDQKGNPANYQATWGGCADSANYNDTTGDHSYPGTYYFYGISITRISHKLC